MIKWAWIFAFRLANAFLVRTFFQPDEYFQSLEPAHEWVFGYGFVTWEWKHALRSFAHPLVFAAIYKAAQHCGDWEDLVVQCGPRVLQAATAAFTDLCTVRLAEKLGGDPSTALVLSLGSAFHWMCGVRTFSNSMETAMTAAAMVYWPDGAKRGRNPGSRRKALWFAAAGCALRPTNVIIWLPLGARLLWRDGMDPLPDALMAGGGMLLANAAADYIYYGRLCFPPLEFLRFNLLQGLATFYGSSPVHYYLSQGLPLLLMAYLPLAAAALWKARHSIWVQALGFVILAYSCIAHKEVRFIYPLLPLLHAILAVYLGNISARTRNRWLISMVVLHILPIWYLSQIHGRGVVDVMDHVKDANYSTVGFLMPCHSTPWQSRVHNSHIAMWMLTCDPPIDRQDPRTYRDEADRFYDNPEAFLRARLTTAQTPHPGKREWPQALVLFEALDSRMQRFLQHEVRGPAYRECARFFNSHFHDDPRRRGDVIVYCTS